VEEHIHTDDNSDALNRVYVDKRGGGEVWIGGIEALSVLNDYHIDAVVTVMHKRSRPANEERMRYMIANRPHVRYEFYDDPEAPIYKVFDESAAFIDEHVRQGHRVLVHCYGGISRSVTLVINYLRAYHAKEFPTVEYTLEYIRKNRPQAGPNKGFISQLKAQ
jgi:protein-tyrosine phosphatase